MAPPTPNPLMALLTRFAGRLRFPQLFALAASLFLLDLLIPDLVPFIDEILLGLVTLLLGTWKGKPVPTTPQDKPPMKDITPPKQ